MTKIAVLLTCFNRKAKTLQCLKNLYDQIGIHDLFDYDVFLVDDSSTDGTSEAVKSEFPDVNVLKGNGQLFWNRGMYTAWEEAVKIDHDYYLWLNDDTLIFANTILEMLGCSAIAGPSSIICGSTCSEITKEYTYGGKTIDGKVLIPNGRLQECHIMEGNCVLISREITKSVGIIDPVFPHAIGDHDYGLRAIAKGFKIFIARIYIGFCEGHDELPKWCLAEVPFKKRIRSLYSPLGNAHPKYFFIYEKRHFGVFKAIKHYLSIHLRVVIPRLWK